MVQHFSGENIYITSQSFQLLGSNVESLIRRIFIFIQSIYQSCIDPLSSSIRLNVSQFLDLLFVRFSCHKQSTFLLSKFLLTNGTYFFPMFLLAVAVLRFLVDFLPFPLFLVVILCLMLCHW